MSPHAGRPREFTYQKRQELIDHVGQGATVAEAACIMGVSLRTVQRESKHNEFFHHDLELALHSAPPDPEALMKRASRTHWRAAAWLLERADPDRYGKRPPNSCSPDKLHDIMAFLIETALQATPPEQRAALYRQMQPAADRAFEALMPDQHESRRWTDALATLPMPLSGHEFAKTLGDPGRNRQIIARAVANNPALKNRDLLPSQTPPAPETNGELDDDASPPVVDRRWFPPSGFLRQDSESMDAEWRYPTPEEEDAYADSLDADEDFAEADAAADRAHARFNAQFPLVEPQVEESPADQPAPGPDSNANTATVPPPDGGNMSPKMSAATKYAATESAPPDPQSPAQSPSQGAMPTSATGWHAQGPPPGVVAAEGDRPPRPAKTWACHPTERTASDALKQAS